MLADAAAAAVLALAALPPVLADGAAAAVLAQAALPPMLAPLLSHVFPVRLVQVRRARSRARLLYTVVIKSTKQIDEPLSHEQTPWNRPQP